MKSASTSRVILAGIFIAAIAPFLAVELFHVWLYKVMDITKYLVFHNIVELFSVIVSMSIFGVGWFTYDQSKDRHILFLSTAFLAIGLMDFMHALSYAGMPAFVTPNLPDKATQFWIAARIFSASAFLASALIYPGTSLGWLSKRYLVTAALAITLTVFTGIIFFPSYIPAAFIEGVGLTPFKKTCEYLIICLLLLSVAAYWRRMSKSGDRLILWFLSAFIISIFSELAFTVYKSVFDTFNMLSHVYKIVAFYLIYRGIFTAAVNNPYLELSGANGNLRMEIAERKRAEVDREQYHRFFTTSRDLMCIADPNGAFIKTNPAFSETLGYSEAELVSRPFIDFIHPDDKQQTLDEMKQQMENGHTLHFDNRYICKDGSVCWLSWRAIYTKEENSTYATARDITEQKRAEGAMWENEARFRMMVESVKDYAIIMLDADGHVVSWNTGAERIKGYKEDEIVGQHFSRFYTLEGVESGKPEKELAVADAEGRFEAEGWRVRKNGSRFMANVVITALRDDAGQLRGFVKVVRDITERNMAEEALSRYTAELERSNAELQQFAYVASHDLQEPLRMVSSYTQLLAQRYEGQLDDKARKYIDYAVDGAVRMQRLINDLLLYSRINTQGQVQELIDSHAVLGDALRDLSAAITESRAIITNDDLPTIRADATQLSQLFQNLIGNAIKFRGADLPRIHVSVLDLGSEWRISVNDNGIGIDQQYAGKVFVIFQRLHTRLEYPGTGIGLAVCKRIVERHGGRIWFESELGKGSTFYFTFPK
ncbi:MAG: PAS domain S-box protein [Desulfuromonadales bacterium]|nr:PAS domain S-box protein [Desulfuromonadales bacterium]